MRIRSIRPEFWSSEDVAGMDWNTRLVYIGLWSYVDDNGVGRDLERLIVSSLFPLDDDLSESSLRVHGALKHLESGGQISRYIVDGKPYVHITAWDTHQKVNRPSESRYPLPTCGNATPHDILTEPSVSPQSILSAGEGEKGRRGEGEKGLKSIPATAVAEASDRFEEFWETYDHKVDKINSEKKWRLALKKPGVTSDMLIVAARSYVTYERENNQGGQFIMAASKWLLNERWTDERASRATAATRSHLPHVDELEQPPDGLSPEEYAQWDAERRARRRA